MLARISSSLRKRLALILLPSLLILLLLSALLQYWLAVRPMEQEFDRMLADVAIALTDHIDVADNGQASFTLSDEAAELIDADALDYTWYAAFNERSALMAGEPELRWPQGVPGQRGEPYFFDTRIDDQTVRAVAVRAACGMFDCGVVLATTVEKRQKLARDMQLAALLPVALLGAVALALMWFGLGSGLRPLLRLSREIRRRSPHDLSPVSVEEAPAEVQPLVGAVNRLMAELGEASQAQQKFLATAAHQLRTPLAGLQSRIELALIETHDERARAWLTEIHESAMRSARLAVQLLSLARVEPGAASADTFAEVDLVRLATELVDEWVPRAIARRIDLGFELAPAVVQGLPLLLREAIVNLLHNALEYTPDGGRVTLATGVLGDGRAFVAVEDNGPGIPAEARAKVLERFVRLPGSPGSGSGLGLAIVQEIAQGHGTSLELLDAPAGKGLLVRLAFPVASRPARS